MKVDLPQRAVWRNACGRLAMLGLLVVTADCDCSDTLEGVPPTGNVEGYVCHPVRDELVGGATVIGEGPRFPVETVTDAAGYFILVDLAAGPQTLAVEGPDFVDSIAVEVVDGDTVRAPDPSCLVAGTGTISGRICATEAGIGSGEGYWLAGATVYVVVGGQVYETTTDADGYFVLNEVPVGTHTLIVEKGSFTASSPVSVGDGAVTTIDHVCVAPSTRIGVVTGQFDAVETVLEGMGFGIQGCLPSGAAWCPSTLDPSGTVTLIEGDGSPYFITGVLDDYFVLQQFDILFFNCGLADEYILSAPDPAKNNLRNWVTGGGSIYASDWAYEILRVVFAGELNFFGNETDAAYRSPDARVGVLDMALQSALDDPTLATVVGSPSVDLIYNKGDWVPLEATQPSGVYVWMSADVPVDSDGNGSQDATWNGAPVLVSKPFGEGRLLFTSFHTHQQASAEMTAILRYIVFEL